MDNLYQPLTEGYIKRGFSMVLLSSHFSEVVVSSEQDFYYVDVNLVLKLFQGRITCCMLVFANELKPSKYFRGFHYIAKI